jgi:superfamily I DNA/RNA helicase/mRNA-degrading endonuclease RelE of RelBE toxin-antitoxin system
MTYELVIKPAFQNQLLALPLEYARQVNDKINHILRADPHPDGSAKVPLRKYAGRVCRLRSGNYRVYYRYGKGWVQLLKVVIRRDAYEDDDDVDLSGEPDLDLGELGEEVHRVAPDWERQPRPERAVQSGTVSYLPMRIDAELLARLRVPEELHAALIACRTEDDLLTAAVPPAIFDRVADVVLSRSLDKALGQPDLIVQEEDDLIRFVEGDLLGFLLKLDPEQERVVDWGLGGSGPTLVKGGPGTGKSTIALYRVQAVIRALLAEGKQAPRVLFTTYTNALTHSSEQLLRRLLGADARYVEIRTADSVVRGIFRQLNIHRAMAGDRELMPLLCEALDNTDAFDYDQKRGGAIVLASAPRMSLEYLLEEIQTVIEARELSSLDEYLAAHRTGRKLPLNARQRTDVWAVYEAFGELLERRNLGTYPRNRRHAAALVRAGAKIEKYDAVIVDEVQDLDPSVLRLLVLLCKAPNRLFITADANQSIYGGSFRWSDVHEDLRFRGRTEVLRTNHRSTREIGEAAQSYLAGGELDAAAERRYTSAGPRPVMREVPSADDEARLLERFFRQSLRVFNLGWGACAVLVAANRTGEAIAERLRGIGVSAAWMTGDTLDLESPTVKVMNLKSAKGLEFPIVALAGFVENPQFGVRFEGEPEEREERLSRERRTMFVGMTRAMRSLLVAAPAGAHTPLLDGFDSNLWHARAPEAVR